MNQNASSIDPRGSVSGAMVIHEAIGRPATKSSAAIKRGRATLQKYGVEHYEEIGRRGGESLANARGKAYYREIGRKSAALRKARRNVA